MSFLGCIGHLLGGSGLRKLLEVIFGENAVKHIISGEAVSRAICGYFLTDAALNMVLASSLMSLLHNVKSASNKCEPMECDDSDSVPEPTELFTTDDAQLTKDILLGLLRQALSVDDVESEACLTRLSSELANMKATIQNTSTFDTTYGDD